MKNVSLILMALLLMVSSLSYGQDIIHLIGGVEIESKVLEINQDNVVYLPFEDLSGSSRTLNKSKIHKVVFENGNEVTLGWCSRNFQIDDFNAEWRNKPLFYDSGANGVTFLDARKEILEKGRNHTTDEAVMYCFSNENNSSQLYFHAENDLEPFKITKITIDDSEISCKKFNKLTDSFVTDKGITLGMMKKDVVEILGDPTEEWGNDIVYYSGLNEWLIINIGKSDYSAIYSFEQDKLVKIEFGFEHQ